MAPGEAALQQLIRACETGDLAAIERALDDGAPVNGVGTLYSTPLAEAVLQQHEPACALLLARGADPNFGGAALTAMMKAASHGSVTLLHVNHPHQSLRRMVRACEEQLFPAGLG